MRGKKKGKLTKKKIFSYIIQENSYCMKCRRIPKVYGFGLCYDIHLGRWLSALEIHLFYFENHRTVPV
jgi:hypothetical protein